MRMIQTPSTNECIAMQFTSIIDTVMCLEILYFLRLFLLGINSKRAETSRLRA